MDQLIEHAIKLASQPVAPLHLPIKNRIAYVVSHGQSYASNGYAIRTQGVAKALNEHGFDTLCFVRPGRPWELEIEKGSIEPEVQVDGVRYIHGRWPQDKPPSNEQQHFEQSVQHFVELFHIYRPKAVLAASNYIVGLPAWVAAKKLNLPFYNEVRGFWELSKDARKPNHANNLAIKQEAERDTFVAQQALKVFTLNQPMAIELAKRGIEADKLAIVPNGVSTLPKIKSASPDLKSKLGISNGDKVVGYIGSFSPYEGLDILIEACSELAKQGEKIKLLLVGDEQPITQASTTVAKLGNQPWLIQTGRVPHDQVADYYALIDAIVIPRKQLAVCERVPPMKAAEALAYGKRLVVSDVPALAEYAAKFKGVVTFKTDKVASLILSIQNVLNTAAPDASKAPLMSENVEALVSYIRCEEANLPSPLDTNHRVDKQDVVIVKQEDLTSFSFPVLGERLVFKFKIQSENPYAHDQVIFGIDIQDGKGDPVESESYNIMKYSRSPQYGRYKYLSATCDGVEYQFSLLMPKEATRCVIKLGRKRSAKIKLDDNPAISFYSGISEVNISSILKGSISGESVKDARHLLESAGFNISYVSDVVKAIESLPATEKFSAAAFWHLWRETNDPYLFEMARQRLVFQGRMYETRTLLNEWDKSLGYRNNRNSARRVDDEIQLLEDGMMLPESRMTPIYKTTNNVLYLLHNRLPYNSGGYATRTHGLLTGVEKNSDYKMHGVSRPGYPSDHAQHISKPLPSPIPTFDVVDDIKYFALDQTVRRSSLTTTEYIEKYAQEVEALAKKKKAGIIHAAANFPNGLAASLAARRLGIKSVYEVRGLWEITRLSRQEGWDETDQFRYMAKMEAEACNAADAVITITEALKDLMVSRGVDASKITVAPNCVHTDLFSPLEKDQLLAEELGLSAEDVVIGYIGSIVNYEGLDDLLDALALLLKDGITNFKFLLVGDGAVLNELKLQVTRLGLEEYVVITGRVPHEEVQRYYSLVDITPFPRKPYLVCEAVSPLKPFEAMASQKAVIVSSCAALTEIIEDGWNGLVFEKGNILSLKNTIKKLITDDNLRKNLSAKGREWVIKERDWSISSKRLKNVYDSIFKENI